MVNIRPTDLGSPWGVLQGIDGDTEGVSVRRTPYGEVGLRLGMVPAGMDGDEGSGREGLPIVGKQSVEVGGLDRRDATQDNREVGARVVAAAARTD